jgi:hypothetical protein
VLQYKQKKSILVGKPEEKRSLGRPRHGLEDNTKISAKEIIFEVGTEFI